MRGNNIQAKITTGRFTLPVAVLTAILCWVVTFLLIPNLQEQRSTYGLWEYFHKLSIPEWTNRLLSLLLYLFIGYFLIEFNNTFSIIRVRASVQTSIYLLFITACPLLHLLYPGDVASVPFIVALYVFFKSYQHPRPSTYLFNTFVLIGLGSLLFPQLILFIPILLIGAFYFQSLTPRSFFAALIGWAMPYLFLFGYAYFYNDMNLFYQPFIELATFQPIDFNYLGLWELVTLGFYFILFIAGTIHSFAESYKDKIRTRIYLRFLILLNIYIFLFIILQPIHYMNLLSLQLIGTSILVGHMFTMTNSRTSNFFFICSNIGLILLFCFNVWMLL